MPGGAFHAPASAILSVAILDTLSDGEQRHFATAPDHPKTVTVREDDLLKVINEFFAERIFGPDRAALLAQQLPATPADAQAQRDKQAAKLHKRLRQIDAAENAHAREVEHLADLDPNSPAVTALRTRILGRFTELEEERATITKQLTALAKETSHSQQPALLDALPMLADQLSDATPRLASRLYEAFDLQLIYSKEMHQVSIHAVITPSTPATLAAIIADSETPDAPITVTNQAGLSVLEPHPIRLAGFRDHGRGPGGLMVRRPAGGQAARSK